MVGSVNFFKKGLVNIRTAIVFGIPSVASVFLTRMFIVPAIPDELFKINDFVVSKGVFLMLIFALLMIFASYSMIKKSKPIKDKNQLH